MVAGVWRGTHLTVSGRTAWCALIGGLLFAFEAGIPTALMAAEQQGDVDARPVITRVNARQLATVLQKAGFAAEFDEEDEDENVVDLSIDGYHAVCFVWDDGARIEFYGGFSDQTLTVGVINDWAASDRLSRVCVSDRGSAGVKVDLYLAPGVTREMVVFYCRAFHADFRAFVDVTIPRDAPDDDPFVEPIEDPFETPVAPLGDNPFGSEDPFGVPGSGDEGPDLFDAGTESPSPSKGDGLFDNPFGDVRSESDGGPS